MNSLLDPFLYELVRAHEQELLEAARVSRVLGTRPRQTCLAANTMHRVGEGGY